MISTFCLTGNSIGGEINPEGIDMDTESLGHGWGIGLIKSL